MYWQSREAEPQLWNDWSLGMRIAPFGAALIALVKYLHCSQCGFVRPFVRRRNADPTEFDLDALKCVELFGVNINDSGIPNYEFRVNNCKDTISSCPSTRRVWTEFNRCTYADFWHTHTAEEWKALESTLIPGSMPELWEQAFQDLFYERLRTSYFLPIQVLTDLRLYEGEGF
jgi:hypothetical protein